MRILLIIILILTSVNAQAKLTGQARIDSLTAEIPNAKQDTNHINLLKQLSSSLYSTSPNNGISYALKAVEIAKEINWKLGEAKSYNSVGIHYAGGKSDYPKALEYFLKSLTIFEEIDDKSGIASSHLNIGNIYELQSDYPQALEYYTKALKLYIELEDKIGIANNYGNIGNVYNFQFDNINSLKYYHKALNIYQELENKFGIARNLGNIGNIYNKQSNYSKALDYLNKSLLINKEIDNKSGIAINLANIGEVYQQQSKSASSKLIQSEKLNKSIEFRLVSAKLFNEIGASNELSQMYDMLHSAYKQKGEFELSLEYMEKHKLLQDSVFNQEKAKDLGRLEAERDYIVKERDEAETTRLQKEADSYRNTMQYLAIGAIVIMLALFLVFSGKLKIKEWKARALVFLTFIFTFEFVLVMIDPWTDEFSEGIPFIKFAINLTLALIIFPLHQYFEKRVSLKVVKPDNLSIGKRKGL